MKIAPFLGVLVLADNCPAGQQLGLTADGGEDPTNDHTCYPSPNAAWVAECNNPATHEVEMRVVISKDFMIERPCIEPGKCFVDTSDSWSYVYSASELSATASKSEGLKLKAEYIKKPMASRYASNGRSIYKEAEIKIDFECIYPLDDQVIDENYTVTGEKILTTRRHVGALYFTIEPTADVFIGERATFTIVPASAGLVNFRAKYCRIAKGVMQHELLGAAGKDYCLDQATDFQVDSNYGSSQAQSASYNAFKWNTPSKIHNSEVQTIECTIEFDSESFDNTGKGEPCPLPEDTEEEPDFRSTLVETNGFVDMMMWDI